MAKHVFLERGNFYSLVEGNFGVDTKLKPGVYNMIYDQENGIRLEWTAEKFNFNFKLYGIDETLVGHVINTYRKQPQKHNIGVLLNGAKGTGKTVTAKELCNRLGLPVVIISAPYPGLSNFISHISHDCIFFFDEFEKNFRTTQDTNSRNNNAGENLLSIMDGVYNGECAHIFILTTNELNVNDNILSRPSRIRYLKSFGRVIDHKIVEEYVNDNLMYPERKDDIMDFIDSLTLSTIDIVKSIVEEVNIHNCNIDEFKSFFNVKQSSYTYYFRYYRFNDNDKRRITKDVFKILSSYQCPEKYRNRFGECEFTYFNTNKRFDNWKPGDVLWNSWRIVKIYEDGILLLCYLNDPTNLEFVKVTNSDAKPSLYASDGGLGGYDEIDTNKYDSADEADFDWDEDTANEPSGGKLISDGLF